MVLSPQNTHKNYLKKFEWLRYLIFISFYILSIRLICISIEHAPIKNPLPLVFVLLAIAILSCSKTLWSIYGFWVAIPLVSGLQVFRFFGPLPFLSLMFASMYLSWLPKRLFFEKEDISPRTRIGYLVDILSGIVLLSLILTFWHYPLDLVLHRVWSFPTSMQDTFFSIHAAYVLLQGLFFYRMMELEIKNHNPSKYIVPVLYVQAAIIIIYSMIQLIFRAPDPLYGFAIFAPFEDIHSYGSYMAALFFIFLAMVYGGNLRQKFFTVPFLALVLLFVILSYSRATWLAVIIVGAAFLIYKLPIRRKVFPISCVVLIFLLVNLFPDFLIKSNQPYINRLGHLFVVKEQFSDYSRIVLWKRALNIISDFPITGSGIGTFYKISPAYQDLGTKEFRGFYENAHNYFLQFASDLGIPALILFLGILFFTYQAGFQVLSKNGKSGVLIKGLLFGLTAYLITCLTGHPLLLSNQQFLFWFVIASIVIPQGFINQQALSDKVSPKPRILFFLLAAMLIGAYTYDLWGTTGIQQYEYGFYGYELWDGKKVRWTEKKAVSKTVVTGSVMDFDLYVKPHNIGPKGLNFKVLINGKLWDEVNFVKSGIKKLRYYIPYRKDEFIEIKTVVSKTFIPIRLGLNKDTRQLGVGISEIKFYDEMPQEGMGFWGLETWTGGPITGWPQNTQTKFRWTGLRASMNIKDRFKNGVTLFLLSSHPDVVNNPVRVEILSDGRRIEEIVFTENQWKKIYINPNTLGISNVLTLQVSRTWNPKLFELSEDYRDLGVAVAIPGES